MFLAADRLSSREGTFNPPRRTPCSTIHNRFSVMSRKSLRPARRLLWNQEHHIRLRYKGT